MSSAPAAPERPDGAAPGPRPGKGRWTAEVVWPSLSVCLPAYNEAATIESVLEETHALLHGIGVEYEIVVCDDGSTDGTGAIIDAAAARLASIRVLRHERNAGIRATFEELYAAAQYDFVFLNATDGQWPMSVLLELLPLAGEWDIVVCRRRDKHYGVGRALISSVFNAVPRLLFGVATHDAGSVKLMRREVVQRTTIVSRSPFNEAERLIRAARAGHRITSRPVDVHPRQAGRSHAIRASILVEAALDVVRVWWSLRGPATPGAGTTVPAPLPEAELVGTGRSRSRAA